MRYPLTLPDDPRAETSAITKKSAINTRTKAAILSFMQGKGAVKASQIAEAIHLQPSRTRDYLAELIEEGVIIAEGANRNRVYRLK